jgi:hypothetical protein
MVVGHQDPFGDFSRFCLFRLMIKLKNSNVTIATVAANNNAYISDIIVNFNW